tara:strand:+ start:424 stop:600 length:177 start_codon:yes stop_codon:yes gene_type:complete
LGASVLEKTGSGYLVLIGPQGYYVAAISLESGPFETQREAEDVAGAMGEYEIGEVTVQ